MKLISMTDFVLKKGKTSVLPFSVKETFENGAKVMNEIFRYADLLKKDIKKGMFVPCDEFDNILEEPLQEHYTDCTEEQNAKDWLYNLEKYNQAKERVLFKGFKVVYFSKKSGSVYSGSISDSSGIIHLFWLDKIDQFWYLAHDLNTVEDLTVLNYLELTETALKEIGLLESKDND
jgi:hypothetical protein